MPKSVKKTKTGRIAQLAALGAGSATKRASVAIRSAFTTDEVKAALLDEFWAGFADDLSDTLGDLRGILLKLGQILSFMEIDMPPIVKQKLAKLQDHATVCNWSSIRPVLENSLGKPAGELFEAIEKLPFASASIGQVHRATMLEGSKVAVKIQYPGIVDAVNADLSSSEIMATAIAFLLSFIEEESKSRTLILVEEIRRYILNELDYTEEARIQTLFGKYYENHPNIHVPQIIDELSTREVLVSEIVEGSSFESRIKHLQENQDALDKIGQILLDYQLGSFFRFSVLNGDPHPGNFRFIDDNVIACLDYGCFIEVDAKRLNLWKQLFISTIKQNDKIQRSTLIKLIAIDDFSIPPSADVHNLKAFFDLCFAPFEDDEEMFFNIEYAQLVTDSGKKLLKETTLSHEMIIMVRVLLGTYSNLARIGCTINCKPLAKQWLNQG